MKNIKCQLAYVGTHYFGFQKTKMGPSIEEKLEQVLEKILQHPIKLQVASRTDRGVHAKAQWVNFFTDSTLPLEKLLHSTRSLLPKDIAPLGMWEASAHFHPTLDAKEKLYTYQICTLPSQLPFHREFSWHYPYPLDLTLMNEGGKTLSGTHDFSAFTSEQYEDAIRFVRSITCDLLGEGRMQISVRGEKFLYKMVRTLVGTLVYVGCGKIPLSHLPQILEGKQRSQAGPSAPAHGLFLSHIFY